MTDPLAPRQRQMVATPGKRTGPLQGLGRALFKDQGEFTEAKAELQRALEKKPDSMTS
jgi:Flp pilus assembly protein TadD